ncbi:MAG: hypothetical protein Q9178_005784 [Gyalolechia marmorata]
MISRIYLVLLALTATLINGSPLQLQQRAKAHYTTVSLSAIVTSTTTSTIPETAATTTTNSLPPYIVVTTATATATLTVTPTSQTPTTDNPVPSPPLIISNPFPTPAMGFLAPMVNDPITVTETIENHATVTKTVAATAVIMATADMTTATVTVTREVKACPDGFHNIFNKGGVACVKDVED